MPDLRGDVRSGRTGAYDPRSLAPWVALLVIIALVVAAAVLAPRAKAVAAPFMVHTTGWETGALGHPTPFNLTEHRGQTVVLDLMAVNCDACKDVDAQVLQPLWAKYGAAPGFAMVSVDTWSDPAVPDWQLGWETPRTLSAHQNATHAPWPHAIDTDRVWEKYDAVALPKLVVVGPDGTIAFQEQGVPTLAHVESAVRGSLAL